MSSKSPWLSPCLRVVAGKGHGRLRWRTGAFAAAKGCRVGGAMPALHLQPGIQVLRPRGARPPSRLPPPPSPSLTLSDRLTSISVTFLRNKRTIIFASEDALGHSLILSIVSLIALYLRFRIFFKVGPEGTNLDGETQWAVFLIRHIHY